MEKNLLFQKALLIFLGIIFVNAENATAQGQWLSAGQNLNNTRNASTETKISVSNVNQLNVKWAFTTAGDVSATPAVDGSAVYFPDWGGFIYKVDAETGELIWSRQVKEFTGQSFNLSRVTPLIEGNQVIFGTQLGPLFQGVGATIISLNKNTGELLWKTKIDDHPWSIVTQSAVAFGNTVYVGVASLEELAKGIIPGYELSFRGSMVALDKNTGAIKWKTYMAPDAQYGFTGNAIWGSTPVIDPKRGSVYVATGNNYSVPDALLDEVAAGQAAGESQDEIRARVMSIPGSSTNFFDAVVSLDMNTGAIKWVTTVIPFDAWTTACFFDPDNCPDPAGPDYDFGQGPALFTTNINGVKTELLGAGQKSGIYWTFNPNTGQIVWSTQVGPGGELGGLQWGSATDGEKIYTAVSNSNYLPHTMGPGPRNGETIHGGFWSALNAGTGEVLWENAGTGLALPILFPPPPGAIATNQAPVTIANGVMFAGAMDAVGTMYAFDAANGNILWSFESGGSVLSGAAVVNGTVFWGSGYSNNGLGTPNNKLFAFGVSSVKSASLEKNNITDELQNQYVLEQAYPNPFNTSTQIRFRIPEAGNVTLKIYNSVGKQVKTLVDGNMNEGFHQVTWDATDNSGSKMSSGIYFYRLTAGTFTQMNKIMLSK